MAFIDIIMSTFQILILFFFVVFFVFVQLLIIYLSHRARRRENLAKPDNCDITVLRFGCKIKNCCFENTCSDSLVCLQLVHSTRTRK